MSKDFMQDNFLGVNYWASHAGIAMWNNWDIFTIEEDFKKLSSCGVKVLRVFPLWPDFQPLTALLGGNGIVQEMSHGEKFLSDDEEGRAGVDKTAVDRFQAFCDLAKKYDLKIIVALITGWMSGRCFFPPAFVGRNIMKDPLCIKWELLFVKYFVKRFKSQENIIAWELGNETNCMAEVNSTEEAFVWSSMIVDAIRATDNTRPVVSGMHGLASTLPWKIKDQASLCDYLTVHPYLLFTEHCNYDKLVSPRTILHAPAESTMYADIGGKPCFVEEIGSLGPTFGGEEVTADFVRANLFNAWSHDSCGFLWWTGFDQDQFDYAPYEWLPLERQLGIFKSDGSPKKSVAEYKKFSEFLSSLPCKKLPTRERDAVCLINPSDWTNAFGAFMLGKRAGLEIEFADKTVAPKKAKLYLLPGDGNNLRKGVFAKLLEEVQEGATLLVSYKSEYIAPFESVFGCASLGRRKSNSVSFKHLDKTLRIEREYAVDLQPITAEVVATDDDGFPLLTSNNYGKGKVLFLNAPIETFFASTAEIALDSTPYEIIYQYAKATAGIQSIVEKHNAQTNITIHKIDENTFIVVAINNTDEPIEDALTFNGVAPTKVYYGKLEQNGKILIPKADAVVFELKKI